MSPQAIIVLANRSLTNELAVARFDVQRLAIVVKLTAASLKCPLDAERGAQ